MNKKVFIKLFNVIFLLVVLLSLLNCNNTKTDVIANRKYIGEIEETRKSMLFYLSLNEIPGASITVSKAGEIIYSEGIGLASKDLGVKVNRNTKFRIGDVSEIFTSLVYQLLVENGTLQPDSSIQFYLPEFPKKSHKITLENLVQQTSGIREEYVGETVDPSINQSILQGIDRFKNDGLKFAPGMYQSQSIYNYNLLGAIMENVTGKKFSVLLNELVTDTLNLENTMPDNPLKSIKNRTDFFDHDIISQVIQATSLDLRFALPAKGLLSTADDLVKFGNAIIKSDYVSENIKTELFTLIELGIGFPAELSNGWLIGEDIYGRKYYGRSGVVVGGGASILIYPEEELVIASAINTTMNIQKIPILEIANFFLPKPEQEVNSIIKE